MRNFPYEYLYVNKDGDCFYKRYSERKVECNINPYTIGSTPVIFDKNATVESLFKLVEKNPMIKVILPYADDFIKESKTEKKVNNVNGNLNFYWYGEDVDLKYFNIAYPKMEVEGIDENNEAFGIDFLSTSDIKDLKLTFDCNVVIYKDNKPIKTIYTHPTLFHVLYGLFWELSFYGKPEDRDAKSKELLQSINEMKKGDLKCLESLKQLGI